jgi:chromosomal replication initiator protein
MGPFFPDGPDVVDLVIEIPLPGRTICSPSPDESAPSRVTLGAFVAGPENRLTASAVRSLLDGTAERAPWTSLAICGPSGTGKTHLARGLVQFCRERDGADSAEYLTAADFRHAVGYASKTNTLGELRGRLRDRKLLAVDDVDRLPGNHQLQQELRSTIDALEEIGAMMIVTAATPLSAARNLASDVRSRFASGLELRLAPPEEAARERLVHHVSAALGRPFSVAAAQRLAAGVQGTAGDVFGALFEFNETQAGSDMQAVDDYLARRAVRRPTIQDILPAVAKYCRVSQKVLKSGSRRQSVVAARALIVYLARELAGLSFARIGRALGGRDHSTIMHNYRKVADALDRDAAIREALADLEQQLRLTA